MQFDGTRRAIDLAIALAATLLLSPLLCILALLIRLDSPGPIFYRQIRYGRHGKPFLLTKFRTLHANTERRPLVAPVGDSRVTRVGHFLRHTHLDELPQLFQVLTGTMSIVGPRPEPPALWGRTPAGLRDRALAFRPGMTSPASLRYLCEDAVLHAYPDPESLYREILLPMKIAEDVQYLEGRTLADDLNLLICTVTRLLIWRDDGDCRQRLHAFLENRKRYRPGAR